MDRNKKLSRNYINKNIFLGILIVVALVLSVAITIPYSHTAKRNIDANSFTTPSVPTFTLTAYYHDINITVHNESTANSGIINYVIHYSTSNSITNKTQNITTANGRNYANLIEPANSLFYFAVDSVNETSPVTATSYSALSSVQSSVTLGIFSYASSKVTVTKDKAKYGSGNWNISIPIASLTGTSLNSIILYQSGSFSKNASNVALTLISKYVIIKNTDNWTFTNVTLFSGSVYIYPEFNYTVNGGSYNNLKVSEFGNATAFSNGQQISGFLFNFNGFTVGFLFSPMAEVIIIVVVILLILIAFYRHEE